MGLHELAQGHHWVWKYPEILHRNISQGNIMDLATWLNNEHDGPTSLFRTGTKPYMAQEQQSVHWQGPHRYCDDMESIFYVMLSLISKTKSFDLRNGIGGTTTCLALFYDSATRINEEATEEDNQFKTDDDSLPDNLLPFNMETLAHNTWS
ncbi:hypothetical protein F5050DRAFT_538291 [Lentinula boryana]|uniref:Fungal-type protein kinase domain-containing protein n=1 Tax=Lentinula boryana TaxID=40481 RepID=A0ABQ8QPQ8_9AGAR|nr:hypothetical protein F5050DRAFT_538291 [Lentinula boryana]